ncbi:hypothetical protein Plhal304r1_c007g0028111 [Plasmopara halstedii]
MNFSIFSRPLEDSIELLTCPRAKRADLVSVFRISFPLHTFYVFTIVSYALAPRYKKFRDRCAGSSLDNSFNIPIRS